MADRLRVIGVNMDAPEMAPFKAVPWPRRRMVLLGITAILPFFVFMLPVFPLLSWQAAWNHNWVGGVLCFGGLAAGVVSCRWFGTWLALKELARQHGEDLRALGAPPAESRYVGMSYSDAIISNGVDTSLDRGWISWASDRLAFIGHGPAFELPAYMIEDVALVKTNIMATSGMPRLFIHWRHPDGSRQSICLEVRLAHSMRHHAAETERLRQWLEANLAAARQGQRADFDEGKLPFFSTSVAAAVVFSPSEATAKDKTIATMTAGAVLLVLLLPLALISLLLGGRWYDKAVFFSGIPFVVVFVFVLLTRQKKRREHKDQMKDDP